MSNEDEAFIQELMGGSDSDARNDSKGGGSDSGAIARNDSVESDLEALFVEDEPPNKPRVDSDFENLFGDHMPGSSDDIVNAPTEKSSKWNSMENGEQDEFLTWLDETPTASSPRTPDAPDRKLSSKSIQSDDDEFDFFIDHAGKLQTQPSENVEQISEVILLPTPKMQNLSIDEAVPAKLKTAFFSSTPVDDESIQKVSTRLNTLLEIKSVDTRTNLAAVSLPSGEFYVPPSSRHLLWSVSMSVMADCPAWYTSTIAAVDESIRAQVQIDCEKSWEYFGGDMAHLELLQNIACCLLSRNSTGVYNILAVNLSSVVLLVALEGEADPGSLTAKILEAMFCRWGTKYSDWWQLQLEHPPTLDGIGGAAFASRSVPLVEMHRHLNLRKFLFFHDPGLAAHLELNCASWSTGESNLNDSKQIRQFCSSMELIPDWFLFGLLSPLKPDRTVSTIPHSTTLSLWDAMLLYEIQPQLFSTFAAASIAISQREVLLQQTEFSSSILDNLDTARVIRILNILYHTTPSNILRTYEEIELVMELSPKQQVKLHHYTMVKEKEKEQILLESLKITEDEIPAASTSLASSLYRKAQLMTGQTRSTLESLSSQLVSRRLVEFDGDSIEEIGLDLVQGRFGLQVRSVVPGSIADRTSLVHAGDLVMTLNGLLVLGLEVSEAQALITKQSKPLYMVIGSVFPKLNAEAQLLIDNTSKAPINVALERRITEFYSRHNPEKAKESGRIITIYRNHEEVLLEELSSKYFDHVMGDPFYLNLSQFCVSVDPSELVKSLFGTERSSEKLFVIDCRPPKVIQSTGKLPTSFSIDPSQLCDEEVQAQVAQQCEGIKSEVQICIMGDGTDILWADFDPLKARSRKENDRRAVDTCALYFLQRGYPHVSVVDGGFLACYRIMSLQSIVLEDCLINIGDLSTLKRYDSFFRYRRAKPSVVASYLASKAKPPSRSSIALSFTSLMEDESTVKLRDKASSLFSNVWKKPAIEEDAPSNSWGWTSRFNKTTKEESKEEVEANQSTSWGWSSRLKSMKVPDGLGSKFKSSVSQAYATAQHKLQAVSTEFHNAQPTSNFDPGPSEKPEILAYIAGLVKGDLVEFPSLGSSSKTFEVEKEKPKEKLSRPFLAKRVIAVTQEYLIVFDPQSIDTGSVKSIHPLKNVVRLRYPNDDIHYLTIVYKKTDEEFERFYRFPFRDSKEFTKCLSGACARLHHTEKQDAIKIFPTDE